MIYKFFSCSTAVDTANRLRSTLDENKLFAASPHTFNDPFECKVTVDITGTEQERRTRYLKDNPSRSEEDFLQWDNGLEQAKWYIEQETRGAILNTYGITCFTRDWENELLWAHYARNHTGFCLGFDEKILSQCELLIGSGQVSYRDDVNPFRFFHDDPEKFAERTIFTKSERWAYEQEFRLIFSEPGIKVLPTGAVTEVILGCRASPELRSEVLDRIGSEGPALYQAIEMLSRYRLTRRRVQKNEIPMTSYF